MKFRTTRSFVVLVLLVLMTGCQLVLPTPVAQPSATPAQAEIDADMALVTFFVEVPADTPADPPVLLSVLDEVTGLALNAQRYPMERVDETHYVVGLPLPLGTVVKYRYSRQGNVLGEEHTSDGRAVRYRLYVVAAPGDVNDVVARWNDTRFSDQPTGRITGTVRAAETDTPLAGLLVTAGGMHALTNSEGHFLFEGLLPGTHNLVVYPLDGAYSTFQQGAFVAAESNTPAEITLIPATYADVTFLLHVPEDTPPVVPLRIAGNLLQLGNTFADLSGGMSVLASRMPMLTYLSGNTYGIILSLPVGADVRYKYTLGDGFWNSERSPDGSFVVRQLVVPPGGLEIEESVETWQAGDAAPITFDIIVPELTPMDEGVSIQFHPYGWTEPLRMWHLGGQRWAYILYSPLDLIDQLGYRYCRADQCGHADDERTPGVFTSGQIIETSPDPQGLPDVVEEWRWLYPELPEVGMTEASAAPRGAGFFAGIEMQTFYQPSLIPYVPNALDEIAQRGANWVVYTPSWTFTRSDPPVLELVTGQDILWPEMMTMIEQAGDRDLNVALRPVPRFPTAVDVWWSATPLDFPFWVSFFDQYRAFALHHADLAQRSGAQMLILGGDWMAPALPAGTLADGTTSNLPQDANQRYQALIGEIRARFDGTLAWALPYDENLITPPEFLNAVDQVYVLWSAPLDDEVDVATEALQAEAARLIATEIKALQTSIGSKPIIISMAYPSVEGAFTGCLLDPFVECLSPEALNYPAPDVPLLIVNFVEQAKAYDAVLAAINQFDWINGVVSRGYYIPAVLQDKSTSVHGKPAEDVLQYWYGHFLGVE